MKDLKDALSDLHSIRHQMARATEFQGYGPASTAFSGLLALAVASIQSGWFSRSAHDARTCLTIWVSTAALALLLSAAETFRRSRRIHSEIAEEMIQSAVEQFFPALVVGVLLTAVLLRTSPENFWLLPGLWAVLFSLGIFASCKFLPKRLFIVGVWYLAGGLCSLMVCSASKTFVPWSMGLVFGIGQLLVAGVLHFGFRETVD